MKKKLLVTAIAATMTAPAAGLAAGPTVYGQAHWSVDYLDNDAEDSVNLSSNISRIGVKGGFDLGQGLEAIYQMEWEVKLTDTNNGQDTLTARNRFAGFKHLDYGTLVVGRHDTPVKVIGREVDLFWSSQLGQNRSLTAIRDGSGLGPGFDFRADNVIGYISPDFGPVHVFAAYVTDHDIRAEGVADRSFPIQDDNDFDAYSVAGIYNQKNLFSGDDSLFIALGYEVHNVKFNDEAGASALGLEDNESALRVTGKYSFGDFTLAGFYQMGMDQGFVKDADRDIFGGGVAYKVGANTFKGQVYVAGELDDTTFLASGNDTGALLYSVGVDHEFSKNVQIYAQAAALDNDKNSSFSLGGAGHGAVAQGTPDETTIGVSVGTRITF